MLGWYPAEENDYPVWYSCLKNSMDRSLVGYSPRSGKEVDPTEQLTLSLFYAYILKEKIILALKIAEPWISEQENQLLIKFDLVGKLNKMTLKSSHVSILAMGRLWVGVTPSDEILYLYFFPYLNPRIISNPNLSNLIQHCFVWNIFLGF